MLLVELVVQVEQGYHRHYQAHQLSMLVVVVVAVMLQHQ
jgi:hypothetical protein